jgi:bifunctional ADP-heptose synthase (sugar kinase/adenylyltransferase)
LLKGGTTQEIVGREIVEDYGGRVIKLDAIPGVSTTRLLAGSPSHANKTQPADGA